MGFPIQWLEQEERFDWTDPIPLDGTAKTKLLYIKELLSAIAYRNDEIDKSYLLLPFYYQEQFRKWFYEEIQKEIDKLIIEFGYSSVEDTELLGRAWSELPQRTHHGNIKWEWDYALLNDFRDVLDKLELMLYKECWKKTASVIHLPTEGIIREYTAAGYRWRTFEQIPVYINSIPCDMDIQVDTNITRVGSIATTGIPVYFIKALTQSPDWMPHSSNCAASSYLKFTGLPSQPKELEMYIKGDITYSVAGDGGGWFWSVLEDQRCWLDIIPKDLLTFKIFRNAKLYLDVSNFQIQRNLSKTIINATYGTYGSFYDVTDIVFRFYFSNFKWFEISKVRSKDLFQDDDFGLLNGLSIIDYMAAIDPTILDIYDAGGSLYLERIRIYLDSSYMVGGELGNGASVNINRTTEAKIKISPCIRITTS